MIARNLKFQKLLKKRNRRVRSFVTGLPADDHWYWRALEKQNALIDNAWSQGHRTPGRLMAINVLKIKLALEAELGGVKAAELRKLEKKLGKLLGDSAMSLDQSFFKDFSTSLTDKQVRRYINTFRALQVIIRRWKGCSTARHKAEVIGFLFSLPEMERVKITKKAVRNLLLEIGWKGLDGRRV